MEFPKIWIFVLVLINIWLSGFTNCEDVDPDIDLDVLQIITRHGYPAEAHIVLTEDGYMLTIHRIRGSQQGTEGGQPILLQHGLLSSSADFVDEGNTSLAFILADAGYDVWMGNARGNRYSKSHVSIPENSQKFWNFSWHEMGLYDLPAVLYYISNHTSKGGEILYLGHSMGTTMFFVMSSKRPDVAKLVKLMVAFAPVAYMTHVRSPVRYLTPFVNDFQWLAKHLGVNQFLPSTKLLRLLAYDCTLLKINKRICENLIFILCGFDKAEFNEDILPIVLSHAPAGTSTKAVLHYAQEIRNEGKFQEYDYGPEGNLIQYGTKDPPQYNLTNIKVPTYFMYANNDLLASPIDVKRLVAKLNNNVGLYLIPMSSFNHVDFIFGKDVVKLVYNPLVKVLQNYTETSIKLNLV